MAGLVLKLNPNERVLINGAVIENGDRRSRLSILTPNVNILRLRDAIKPSEATTPVRRVCYIAQLVLSGDVCVDDASMQLQSGIKLLSHAFADAQSHEQLSNANQAVLSGDFYKTLKHLRSLLEMEDLLLARAQ